VGSELQRPPFVSVIVPVYNDAARLGACLEALRVQTYPPDRYEVIVVDNGSDDDPARVVPHDERFKLITELEPGSYAARNSGLSLATGDVLAFTDADCIPLNTWIEEAVRSLDAHPAADLVGGAVDIFFEKGEPTTPAELYESRHGLPQALLLRRHSFAVTANMITRRTVFDRVGHFDSRLKSTGDAEFGQRVAGHGGVLRYAPTSRVRHPARATSEELFKQHRRINAGIVDAELNAGAGRSRFVYLALRQAYLFARSAVAVLALGRPPSRFAAKASYLSIYAKLRRMQAVTYLRVARGRREESPRS
jgi:glycosyltransferase involved in cell wall biosynthesis